MTTRQPIPQPANAHSQALAHHRLLRSDGERFGVYAIDVSTDGGDGQLAGWLVLDNDGHVVARAHSELLAVAKMQVLLLAELASGRGAPPGSRVGEAPSAVQAGV